MKALRPILPRFSPRSIAAGLIALGLTSSLAHAVAFPGAEGFGANATGGTTEYKVTSLDDSGPGSLRDAVSQKGRDVTFGVAGTIVLKSILSVSSDTTIDGTTAPSPGITVTGFSTSLSKQNNIVIRNLRFREGETGGEKKCTIAGNTSTNIILDHCSIEWGRWDCLEFTATGSEVTSDITVQYCIIGESIPPQRFGFLIDRASNISVHHNLFIDNESRNPKDEGNGQYLCNVVYNWGHSGGLIGSHSAAVWKSDIIDNFFLAGPSSSSKWVSNCKPTDTWYQSNNYVDMNKNGNPSDGAVAPDSDFTAEGVTLVPSPQFSPSVPVTLDPPAKCYEEAAAGHLGCQPLDDVDLRLVDYVKSAGAKGQIGKP